MQEARETSENNPMGGRQSIGRDTVLCFSLAEKPGTFGSRFHNSLGVMLGLDLVYMARTTTDLSGAIQGIKAFGIRGCSISMPFKEAVIPMLDSLDGTARAIDSVNTIVNTNGVLVGYNTDYKAVYDLLKESGVDTSLAFLISGSGGMAKAVAAAFRDAGFANGTILARNEEKGQALAGLYGFKYLQTLPPEGSSPILVNATPLGMKGKYPDILSFPDKWVRSSKLVFDVVASPLETPLLKLARDLGIATIDGGQVAVIQALEQFKLYTGCEPTPDQVAQAASFARNI